MISSLGFLFLWKSLIILLFPYFSPRNTAASPVFSEMISMILYPPITAPIPTIPSDEEVVETPEVEEAVEEKVDREIARELRIKSDDVEYGVDGRVVYVGLKDAVKDVK